MLDFYMDLPAWFRTVLAVVVLAVGITLVVIGYRNRPQTTEEVGPDGRIDRDETVTPGAQNLFRFGIVVTGVGTVLLCVAAPSKAEKNGYRF